MSNSVNSKILSLFLSVVGIPVSNEFSPEYAQCRNRVITKAIFDPSQDRCEEVTKT